ncbi:MAG: amidohydrolase family protein [Pseudomonadota bacterium]
MARRDPDGLAGSTRLASAHPAQALGLADRGSLTVGKRADLFVTDAHNRVVMTMRAGSVIHADGTLALDAPVLQPAE